MFRLQQEGAPQILGKRNHEEMGCAVLGGRAYGRGTRVAWMCLDCRCPWAGWEMVLVTGGGGGDGLGDGRPGPEEGVHVSSAPR